MKVTFFVNAGIAIALESADASEACALDNLPVGSCRVVETNPTRSIDV